MHSLKALVTSRRRVLLLTVVLLVLLDLGRSLAARAGYAEPVTVWQPDPKVYADIAWPPGSDLPANAPAGQRVYAQHCQVCHGPDGRGNGPAAPSLIPRPRDFTLGQFKYKSTPANQPPSDSDLMRVVSDGLQSSAMPYWRDVLSEPERLAVVQYIKGFSPVFATAPQALSVTPRVPATAESIARGQQLYTAQGCANCHAADARGGPTFKDAKGYPVVARDLTAPWTFRGGSDPEQLWLRLTTGLAPGPMPSFADKTTPAERWDLVNYILALARTPPWAPGGKADGPGQQANLEKRGEYLVHAEMCGLCHTSIDHTGIYRADDYYLAGGMRVEAYPHGTLVSRNLTSDPATGLGAWSEDQIVAAITTGRSRGRVLNVYDMPWVYLHSLSADDALAIAKYLKTLPPVPNQIPAPLQYGALETIVNKLSRPLPAVPTTVLTFGDGQWGQAPGALPRNWPQTLIVAAEVLVLLLGLLGFVFATPRGHRVPRRLRSWIGAVLGLGVLGLCALMSVSIYDLPQLTVIPPDVIAAGVSAGVPQPNPASLAGPEQTALAQRGRYIYTVASCALCHSNDGSGGLKVSWQPMGTLWARNITPDMQTGIGRWSDAELERAIRSGVSRDGYALHWQGMIWDHASNWDEEDLRAVVTYLRALPPVAHKIPDDRAPAPDDCAVYTFWTSSSTTYGCK